MNYSEESKSEVLESLDKRGKNGFMFLCAITKCLGTLSVYKNGFRLSYELKNQKLAMLTAELLKKYYSCEVDFSFNGAYAGVYNIQAPQDISNKILADMNLTHYEGEELVLGDAVSFVSGITNRMWAQSYIQGLYVCSGTLYFPDDVESRGGYHVEISLAEQDFAQAVVELLARCELHFSCADRENVFGIYSKSSEKICDFLAFIKSMNAVILLSEIMVKRGVNNNINRQANFYASNADKTISSNGKYIEAIETIENIVGLSGLDDKLMAVAMARKQDTAESMSQLAKRLDMSKSGVARALAKIVDIAVELKAKSSDEIAK